MLLSSPVDKSSDTSALIQLSMYYISTLNSLYGTYACVTLHTETYTFYTIYCCLFGLKFFLPQPLTHSLNSTELVKCMYSKRKGLRSRPGQLLLAEPYRKVSSSM